MFRGKTLTFVLISCFMALMLVGCFGSSTEQNDTTSTTSPVTSGGTGTTATATAVGTLASTTGTVTFTPVGGGTAITVTVTNGTFSAALDTTKAYNVAVTPTGGTAYTVNNITFPAGTAPAVSLALPATTPSAAGPVNIVTVNDRTSTTPTVTKNTVTADAGDATTGAVAGTTTDLPTTISDTTAPVITASSFLHASSGDVDRDNLFSAGDILQVQITMSTVESFTLVAEVSGDVYKVMASKKFTTATQFLTVKTTDLLSSSNYDSIKYYQKVNSAWVELQTAPMAFVNHDGGIVSTGTFAYDIKIYDAAGNYANLNGSQVIQP